MASDLWANQGRLSQRLLKNVAHISPDIFTAQADEIRTEVSLTREGCTGQLHVRATTDRSRIDLLLRLG